jgi:phage terminase large subunit-like protein
LPSRSDALDAALERMTPSDWEKVKKTATPEEAETLAALIEKHKWVKERRKLYQLYPDMGPLRRELYAKHLEFYAAGALHQERAIIAANRVGKTICISYEATCHMTGWYPDWWVGRRFNRPVVAWFAGEDAKAVRESLQKKLLGPPEGLGTGLIPHDLIIGKPTAKSGVPEAYDAFNVKHAKGGMSRGLFKAYDQGRESFQAAEVDVMVFDEEPDEGVYSEGLTRTISTVPGVPNGIVMCGFTPLKGLSKVVLMYLPGGKMAKAA